MPTKTPKPNVLLCCHTRNQTYQPNKSKSRLLWMRYWKWCLLASAYVTLFTHCSCSVSDSAGHHRHHHMGYGQKSAPSEKPSQLETPPPTQKRDYEEEPMRISCPNCVIADGNYRHDRVSSDSLRLEAIKKQILLKLGLKTKPNVTSPVPREVVLETIYRAGETSVEMGLGGERDEDETDPPSTRPPDSEQADDFYGRTSEIIAFAEPGHTLNGQPLLEFSHPHDESTAIGAELRVKGASLWVRVDFRASLPVHFRQVFPPRNLTLWVFRILHTNTTQLSGKEFDEHTEMAASLLVTLSNLGWQKFDLTSTVRDWYTTSGRNPHQRLRLLVDCSGCRDLVEAVLFRHNHAARGAAESLSQDPQRPFLVIHTDPAQTKRVRRRALDCSGAMRGQCCKQRFYVSFKQLGWEDWIIAPGGYYANYCRGDCGGIHRTPDTFLNYYTHVIEEFRKMDQLSGMQPCCAPLKFSSMSLIYFGPDSNIIKRDLPKMVVDECGCP